MERKLDIGSGLSDLDEYIKLDNLSDGTDLKEYVDVIGNGNDLPFKDNVFDVVQSSRCIGYYADAYEAVRVLRPGGRIQLNVWTEKLGYVLDQLLGLGIRIDKLEGLNYDPGDGGYYDIWIEGIKP